MRSSGANDLPNLASSAVVAGLPSTLILRVYEKIYPTKPITPVVPQHRSFRRFVRKMFASFHKRQTDGNEAGFQKDVIQRLKGIEDMIARKTARQTKRNK